MELTELAGGSGNVALAGCVAPAGAAVEAAGGALGGAMLVRGPYGGGCGIGLPSDGMNCSESPGNPSAAPGDPGLTICGVIMTTSSVCSRREALLLKSRPRIGMSPMPGIFCMLDVSELFNNPAMANV